MQKMWPKYLCLVWPLLNSHHHINNFSFFLQNLFNFFLTCFTFCAVLAIRLCHQFLTLQKRTLENSFIKVGRTEKFQCEQLLMLLQILEAQLLLYSPSMLATPSSVGHYHQQKKGMVLSWQIAKCQMKSKQWVLDSPLH